MQGQKQDQAVTEEIVIRPDGTIEGWCALLQAFGFIDCPLAKNRDCKDCLCG